MRGSVIITKENIIISIVNNDENYVWLFKVINSIILDYSSSDRNEERLCDYFNRIRLLFLKITMMDMMRDYSNTKYN